MFVILTVLLFPTSAFINSNVPVAVTADASSFSIPLIDKLDVVTFVVPS